VLPPRRAAKDASAAADAFVASAGLAFSAALACAASRAHEAQQAASGGVIFGGAATTTLLGAGCAGAWICLLGATASDGGDVLALLRGGSGLKARCCARRHPLRRVAAAENHGSLTR
jgi:hypothetical protein